MSGKHPLQGSAGDCRPELACGYHVIRCFHDPVGVLEGLGVDREDTMRIRADSVDLVDRAQRGVLSVAGEVGVRGQRWITWRRLPGGLATTVNDRLFDYTLLWIDWTDETGIKRPCVFAAWPGGFSAAPDGIESEWGCWSLARAQEMSAAGQLPYVWYYNVRCVGAAAEVLARLGLDAWSTKLMCVDFNDFTTAWRAKGDLATQERNGVGGRHLRWCVREDELEVAVSGGDPREAYALRWGVPLASRQVCIVAAAGRLEDLRTVE